MRTYTASRFVSLTNGVMDVTDNMSNEKFLALGTCPLEYKVVTIVPMPSGIDVSERRCMQPKLTTNV